MTVRATESRLPSGFTAADLGEAAVVLGQNGSEDYALVSYLTSPLAEGYFIDYVVFVTNGVDVASYDWTFEMVAEGDTDTSSTDVGTCRYAPVGLGLLKVTVELNVVNRQPVTLSMIQEVRPLFTGYEYFFEAGGLGAQLDPSYSIAALGSDAVATAELINSFRNYILSSAATHQLPPRLLAAIVYLGITAVPKNQRVGLTVWTPGRDQKLEWAADDLNGSRGLRHDLDDALGVCQLAPPKLATIVGSDGLDGDTHTTWQEKAADGSGSGAIDHALWSDFDALTTEQKTDLYNLARFPGTNIELCAALLAWLRDRPNRWPGLTADQLLAEQFAVETLASELDDGPNAGTQPTSEQAPGESPTTRWGRKVVGHLFLPIICVSFQDSLQDGASNYGGVDLGRGDNGPGTAELQQDLREVGFAIIDDPDGVFDRTTEWAVREFQIYAKCRYLALETGNDPRYLARLEQALNLYHYPGPISGVVNVGTRILIDLWKRKNWRCPVVVEAWDTDLLAINDSTVPSRTQPAAGLGNIWRHDQAPTAQENEADSRLMFVRDFSERYHLPDDRIQDLSDPDDLIDAGCHFQSGNTGGPLTRAAGRFYQREGYPAIWAEAEIFPDNLLGKALASLTAAELTTFKVVRAVSEVECLGYFDSVNCWDTAFVSMGPSHWTLGLSNPIREGELCGYLAYLAAFEPAAFVETLERFGVRIDERWIDAAGDTTGRDLYDSGSRKFTGWVALQDDDGQYTRQYFSEDDANYFRNWHWHYRWVMAGRTIEGFQRGMWDMVRIRLRDVVTTPIPAAAGIPDVPDGNGGTRAATIGDCFTSEATVAMLLRWHIYQPADICTNGEAGPRAVAALGGVPAGDPTTWDQDVENSLMADLIAEVANTNLSADRKDLLTKNLNWIRDWPNSAGRAARDYALPAIAAMSAVRNSFRPTGPNPNFDVSGLPGRPV
jgi:peptidoglycan hydrolase-like protein with peptidoglycan-binding domain